MRKIIVVISIVMLFILQACSVSEGETSVSILNAPTSLDPGETFQLELDVNNPSGLRIHYQTSDRSVLIVDDNGLVYGVSEGTAFITASIGGVVSEPVTSSVSPVLGDTIFDLINNLSYPYIREEVIAARGAYDALNDTEKLKVTNLIVLEDAESYFDEIDDAYEAIASLTYPYVFYDFYDAANLFYDLSSNQKVFITNKNVLFNAEAYFYEIEVVFFEINQLPYTLDEETVTYVRSLYDGLALSQKELVTNYQDLLDAEALLEVFQNALEVQNMIAALEEPYIEAEVTAAREAYNALNDEQKNAVNNLLDLVAAENWLYDLGLALEVDAIIVLLSEPYDSNDVEEARYSYDELTSNQKLLVTNLALLEAAEQALLDLEIQNDKDAALIVDTMILNLTSPYDLDDVEEARNKYDELTTIQQGYVVNLSLLEAAEQALLDMAAAKVVVDLIETLVEPYDKSLVTNVRTAYDNLTTDEQSYVTNVSKLETAEQTLFDIASASMVESQINNLSTDPVDVDAVTLARAAYDNLTDEQKLLVTNLSALEALELVVVDLLIASQFDQQVTESAMLYQSEFEPALSNDIDYGNDVVSSDRYVVVGAPKDSGNMSSSGLVYVYDLEDPNYLRVLEASNATIDARFGESVSISGDYIVVGAPFAGTNTSGLAYVYKISDDTYERIIVASDAAFGDRFGYDVAIDGDLIIVSAHSDDDLGNESGSIYRYSISNTASESKVLALDGGLNHYFGWRVAINQTVVIVSAYGKTVDSKTFAGGIYVYDRTTWEELHVIEAFDATSSHSFGHDIALTETHIIVGATGDSDEGTASGAVYIYDLANLSNVKKITTSDGVSFDNFGYSVAANDEHVFVSARGDDDQGNNSGSLYMYPITGEGFEYKISLDDGEANDLFGHRIFANNERLLVGAINRGVHGTVVSYNLAFKTQVVPLRTSFEALTDNQKDLVEKLVLLQTYEAYLVAIEAFEGLIDPIRDAGAPVNLLPDQSDVLNPANTAYDALTLFEKLLIDKDDIKVLFEANAYFDAVDDVIAAIALNIYGSSSLKVEARAMYEALDDTQQTLVTNYSRLVEAEQITSQDFAAGALLIDTGVDDIIQIEASDLDFDGDLDFVYATQNTLGVIMNLGSSYQASTIDTFTSGNDFTFGLIDSDREGIKDIMLQDPESTFLIIYDNNANGSFTKKFISGGLKGDSKAFEVADFNEDGYEDFAYISSNSNALRLGLNNQDGTFTITTKTTSSTYQMIDIDVVDIDSDGDLDIVAIASNQTNIKLLLNDGNETFTIQNISTTVGLMTDVVTGDFNDDGFIDIIVAHRINDSSGYLTSYTKRFLNNGSLSFTMNSESSYGHRIGTLITGDLEGDGDLDVLFSETTVTGYTQNLVLGVYILRQHVGELGNDGLFVSDVSTVLLIDNNDDGLNDIVYVTPDGKIYLAINEYVAPIISD